MAEKYTFDERTQEKSSKTKTDVPVVQTSRYIQSKRKAIELIEKKEYELNEGDFWILKNEDREGKTVYYTGLIITHNACLKINRHLPDGKRFKPSCVTKEKDEKSGTILYTYVNDEQEIFDVGEASPANCKNAYMYCMALKRLQDRVILKLASLAEEGIYSEDESEEFKEDLSRNLENHNQVGQAQPTLTEEKKPPVQRKTTNPGYGKSVELLKLSKEHVDEIKSICDAHGLTYKSLCAAYNVKNIEEIKEIDYENCKQRLEVTPYFNKENKKAG